MKRRVFLAVSLLALSSLAGRPVEARGRPALLVSGLGVTAVGIAGFSLGAVYASDAEAKYDDYWNSADVASQEDIDALQADVDDLDGKSTLWYNVGWGGSVLGAGLLVAWIATRGGGAEKVAVQDDPLYSVAFALTKHGGAVQLAARF